VALRRFLVAGVLLAVLFAAPSAYAADNPPTTTAITALPIPSGIELPNSGQAPVFSGDRGGWAQLALFGLVTLAMLAIFVRVAYATRRRTKARVSVPTRATAPATPLDG
jgi:predicted outer membrane protein